MLGGKRLLHPFEQVTIKDRGMLGETDLTPVSDFADVKAVAQKIGERASCEGDPADSAPIRQMPHFCDDPPLPELLHELAEACELKVAAEDEPHTLGFLLVEDELLVSALVSEWHHAADPKALASSRLRSCRGCARR